MRTALRPRYLLTFAMAGALLFSGTGCDLLPADIADEVMGFLMEWSDAHDVNPQTPGGAVNLAKRAASGSTGDEEADAIIGAFKPIEEIKAADKDMEEGRQLRAQGKLSEAADSMDDAIAARPQDWTYRVSRAALAFQNDDAKIAREQRMAGDEIVPWDYKHEVSRPLERVRYATQTIDELEKLNPSKMSQPTKIEYYAALQSAYRDRGLITDDQGDLTMGVQYRGLWEEAQK